MGKKNTMLNWDNYIVRAVETLGYVPPIGRQPSPKELTALGFNEAGEKLAKDLKYYG